MSAISQPAAIAVPDVVEEREPPRGSGRSWWRYVLAVLTLVWALFPVLFLLSAALNKTGSMSTTDLVPNSLSFNSFQQLFDDPSRPYTTWYKNTLLIAGGGALATVFIGACAAYAFSRLRFAGRRPGLLALLLLQLFPGLLAVVAMYLTFSHIGDVVPSFGLNTTMGLLLAYLGGAMGANIWLLKGYFDTIPKELDEAALVDGASHARIFFTMTLRLVMPILVTVFMLAFVGLFGEFMLASIFLVDSDKQTLAVGLYTMNQGNDANRLFGQFAAGALLGSVPTVLLYLVFQKQLVSGATTGSVK